MKTLQKLSILLFATILWVSCSDENTANSSSCSNECAYTIASGETAGTVPASIQGSHTLTFNYSQNGSPVNDGTMGTFILADNMLTIEFDGKCITLKNPIQTSPSEVTFVDDCDSDLKYSASWSQSGTLNEVNLFSLSGTFYGQFN